MLTNRYVICFGLIVGLGLAGCGESAEQERAELQVLGGKADIPSWMRHIPVDWGCDQTLNGKFTGWDSAHLYSFPGKIGYEYTFDFAAKYPAYKGAAIAVYDSENGQRVAYQRNRWSNKASVVYKAEKSIKYLVAVYSISVYAVGSYTLGAACELLEVTCQNDAACAPDEFCMFATGCGTTGLGVCTVKPTAIIRLWAPVCGCDGKTYGNVPEAHSHGVSVDYVGECTPKTQCELDGGYCTHWMTPCKDGYVGSSPSDCPMGRSGKCCVPAVTVTTDAAGYRLHDQINATVTNGMQASIFLGGCSALSWQQQVNGAWVDQGPDHVCVWEGYGVEVKAGDAVAETLAPKGTGTFRLSAGYGVGCTPGLPLSQANCTAHHIAYGPAFQVKDCPMLSMPNPATFCPNGKIAPRYDAEKICITGYTCETCEVSDCGPALGMPITLCPDGVHTSGPTGKCLANGWGGCEWEVLSCP